MTPRALSQTVVKSIFCPGLSWHFGVVEVSKMTRNFFRLEHIAMHADCRDSMKNGSIL
jgi:hypothetical protein